MSSLTTIRILHIFVGKCSSFRKEIIDLLHGGGTLTTTTRRTKVGMSRWIVLWLTQGVAPVSLSTQWATLIGKHIFFDFLLSFDWPVLMFFSLKSTEHDYVKANIPSKLLQIQTFGRLELTAFKDLISPPDYKACEKIKESRPTWYSLTADVFVKFLYKEWFCIPSSPFPEQHFIFHFLVNCICSQCRFL